MENHIKKQNTNKTLIFKSFIQYPHCIAGHLWSSVTTDSTETNLHSDEQKQAWHLTKQQDFNTLFLYKSKMLHFIPK